MKLIVSIFFTFLIFSQLQGNHIHWSTSPTIISSPNVNASDQHLAISANGDVVAIWLENNIVKSSSKLVNSSWTAPSTISGTTASSPRIVSDLNGNATAVWVESGVIKAASKTLNGNWGSSSSISGNGSSSPVLCVDAAGNVVSAWVRGGNIETSTKPFGMNWQPRVAISSNSAAAPSIAVAGNGSNSRVALVWQGVSNNNTVIFASTKLNTGPWSSAQTISNTAHNAIQPSVAVDSNSNVTAVWLAYDLAGISYVNVIAQASSRSSLTDSWSAVTNLSLPGIGNPSKLITRVAYDNLGNAIALWNISFDEATYNIESAVKPVNANWSSPVDLVSSNLYAYTASLSTTTFGDVLGIYSFYNGSSILIQSSETDINGFMNNVWSVPLTISQGVNNAFPKIAATLKGNIINTTALWLNYNGVNTTVVALAGSKSLVLPPTNLAVTQSVHNFGVFNEYYNTLTWQASTDPNVVGYLIFRNGLFIKQVPANVLQYIDDNRTQNGSAVYGVAALDKQQMQSAIVNVSFP